MYTKQEIRDYYNENKETILPIMAGVGTFGAVAGFRISHPFSKAALKEFRDKADAKAFEASRQSRAAFNQAAAAKKKTASLALKALDNANQLGRQVGRQLVVNPEFQEGYVEGKQHKKELKKSNIPYRVGYYKGYYLNKNAKQSHDFEPVDIAPAVGGGAAFLINRRLPLMNIPLKIGTMGVGVGGGLAVSQALRKGKHNPQPLVTREEFQHIRSKDDLVRKTLPAFIRKKQLETEKFKYGGKAFQDKYLNPNNRNNFSDETRNYYKLHGIIPKY